eukprot:TRINITY_DN6516_c0_g1_i2.p1 TRINITY_DN6516_c0_g1~~TRINITY_DN6516_c0_g1_i2.p1  ORF type:complete len:772 (+),score=69.19 TRINITY_DN6516_c0_g1_i2:37-2352(+)
MRRSWKQLSRPVIEKKGTTYAVREYEGLPEVSDEERTYNPIVPQPRVPLVRRQRVAEIVPEEPSPPSEIAQSRPLRAEIVQPEPERQFNEIQHYQDPEDGDLYLTSAFPPLPDCTDAAKLLIITLRNKWYLNKLLPLEQQAVGYPFALEELLVRASLRLDLDDETLSGLLLDAFTAPDEEDLLVEQNIIVRRLSQHEFIERAGCSCYLYTFHKLARTPSEPVEDGRRPKIFSKSVVDVILSIINYVNFSLQTHWPNVQKSSHLLIRFYARHGIVFNRHLDINRDRNRFRHHSQRCFVREFYEDNIINKSEMTDNVVARFYAKERIDYVHGFWYSHIIQVDNKTYGDTLEQVLFYNTSKGRYAQTCTDAMRTCSGLLGPVYLTISTWCSIVYSWQHHRTLEAAMQLSDALLERYFEEFGNYRSIPLDNNRHVRFERGRLKGAILPLTLGMRYMIMIFNMMAPDFKRQHPRLKKLREIIDELVVDSPYSRSITCLDVLREKGTEPAFEFARKQMLESSTVRLVPAAVLNVLLESALDEVRTLRRKREPYQELARGYAADAMHIMASNKHFYFKSDYTGTPAPEVIAIIEEKIFKLLIRSEDAASASTWVFEVMGQERVNLTSYISIILRLCAQKGYWRTGEATMFAYLVARPEYLPDETVNKHSYLLSSHLVNPPKSTDKRTNRIFEIAMQVVLQGEPVSVDVVTKVLRLCGQIANLGGDVLIPIQNKSFFFKWTPDAKSCWVTNQPPDPENTKKLESDTKGMDEDGRHYRSS